MHAGLEGRALMQFAFGRVYYAKARATSSQGYPRETADWLSLLSIIGAGLFLARRLPRYERCVPTFGGPAGGLSACSGPDARHDRCEQCLRI